MTTRDTIKGAFYVDLIAEWKAGAAGDDRAPKSRGKRRPKGRRPQRSRRAKEGELHRSPVTALAA